MVYVIGTLERESHSNIFKIHCQKYNDGVKSTENFLIDSVSDP